MRRPQHTKLLVPQAPKISLTCLPNEPDQYGWFDMLHEKLDVQKENAGEIMEEDEIGLEQVRGGKQKRTGTHDFR